MDTRKKSDKSQPNGSERGNPHSNHSRQEQRSKNKPSRKKRLSEKRRRENGDFTEHGSSEKRYNQRQDYRNDRHRSYHQDEYHHNNSRHGKRQWNQNSRPGRSKKWNNSGTRYGNRKWNRSEAYPFDEAFPGELNYCDTNFASDEPFVTPNESFYQQRDIDTQQIGSSSNERFADEENLQRDKFETTLQAPTKNQQPEETRTQSNRGNFNKRGPRDKQSLETKSPTNPQNVESKKAAQEISEQSSCEQEKPSSSSKVNPQSQRTPPPQKTEAPKLKTNTEASIQKGTNELFPHNPHETQKNTPSEQRTQPENTAVDPAEFEVFEQIFIKPEPGIETTDTLLTSVKTEPLDNTDLDLELSTCLNYETENQFPSISVIPISELIKSELKDIGRNDIVAQSPPTRGRLTLRPNLVQRRKVSINEDNSENLSENLVKRVANMDKVGIKNVINNTGTKYDAALKIQARKRLREEIRKQLKSANFPSPDSIQNNGLVPDEIVDSMNIPAVILDEIRKAFGIVLVEDMKVIPETKSDDSPQAALPPSTEAPSKSPDLKSRLKMLEELKSQTSKSSPGQRAAPSPRKDPRSKSKDEVVVINSSSSSSSSSSSGSDSDSSSSSSDSNASTTSSFKRRRRKKRILEDNVVGNFEKLILPNLTQSQRRRYREKYSKATKSSLQYIYGVCVSRAHPNDIKLDAKEKLKLKRNLTSSDNTQALEVLMKAILNLFERQKEKRRLNRDKPTTSGVTVSGGKSRSKSEHSNPVNRTKKPNESSRNEDSENELASREETETAITARSVELPKHQSTRLDKDSHPSLTPSMAVGGVNRNDGDSIRESAKSAQGEMLADGGLVARESDSESDLDNLPSSENILPMSRLWKSPGEKKCIELETPLSLSGLGSLPSPFGMHSMDLDALTSQRTIGDEAVRNIREIDVKLMELHKRKMYIEEMILKLHKDKMEVDLWTMKLQNEKFILLNSALAGASTNTGTLLPPKTEKASTSKRKPSSPAFSEKLRSRKKRCQNDILVLKDAEREQDVTCDSSQLMQQPRRTRSEMKCKREEASTSEPNKTETPAVAMEVATAEKDDDPPPAAAVPSVQTDYTDVGNGSLEGWKLPITQIIVVGEAIVAASEDGNIYKFNIRTRELESKFSKHTEAITQIFICPRENFVYTTSLDGFLKKTSVENFGLEIHSLNLQEPLQSIDIEWSTAFIGSRWGNIFTYSIKSNSLSESLLCSSGSSIIALKATKEGPRKVLIVSSKGNQINFRDAMTGLLLRSLDVPDNLHIYSILLDDGCIFCGTQRNEIHKYNFTTGGRLAVFQCGNGAVSMKMYKDKYIFVGCYDGFVYVLDKTTGCQIGRFPGSGKMILALEIAGDKLITSAKDNSMQIIDIPKYIVTKDKT